MGQEVWKQVAPELVKLIVLVIVAFIGAARAGLIELAKAKAKEILANTTASQRETVLSIVEGAVQTVEQLYKKGVIQKPAKFDEAFRRARASLEGVHLNPTDEQIGDMIEAAVKLMTDMGTEFKKELTLSAGNTP